MKKPVKTKNDFVRRYKEGEFGNRVRTWSSLAAALDCGDINVNSLFHLRNRIKGGPTIYDIPYPALLEVYGPDQRYHGPEWYVSEMAPTEHTVIQGEFTELPNFKLTYTRVKKPMRDALKEQTLHLEGLAARFLLEGFMDQPSIEQMNFLLQNYPDHVIEFSTYSVRCGIEKLNTIFWECRQYVLLFFCLGVFL